MRNVQPKIIIHYFSRTLARTHTKVCSLFATNLFHSVCRCSLMHSYTDKCSNRPGTFHHSHTDCFHIHQHLLNENNTRYAIINILIVLFHISTSQVAQRCTGEKAKFGRATQHRTKELTMTFDVDDATLNNRRKNT